MRVSLTILVLLAQIATSRQTATISGRVVLRDGKPEANIRVMAVEARDSAGKLDETIVSFGITDAFGNYRLEAVPPGRYVIAAGFVDHPSFYPGVDEYASARVLTVAGAATLQGIDFAETASFKLTGRVSVLDNQQVRSGRGTQVRLLRENGQAHFTPIIDGKFEFRHLRPGHYGAMVNPGVNMVPVHIVVVDHDISNVELIVPTTKSIVGKVVIEGAGLAPSGLELQYDASNPEAARVTAYASIARPDRSFRVTLPQGRLGTVLLKTPDNYSIRSVSYGFLDVLRNPLTITAAGMDEFLVVLEPVPTPNGGQ